MPPQVCIAAIKFVSQLVNEQYYILKNFMIYTVHLALL
jgi:hypothetical protein